MDTKLVKKILTIVALATLAIDIGMLIGAIFGLKIFEGVLLKIFLSSATFTVASTFAITAVSYIHKQAVLSIINLALLGILTILALIIYWQAIAFASTFARITVNLAVFTVLFCILVGIRVKLDNKFLALQIVTYSLVIVAVILLTLLIWGVDLFGIKVVAQLIGVEFLVAFAMLCVMSIMSRKAYVVQPNDPRNVDIENITIPKIEYQSMKEEIERLKAEIKQLKGE